MKRTSGWLVAALAALAVPMQVVASEAQVAHATWSAQELQRFGLQSEKRIPTAAEVAGTQPAPVPNPYLVNGPARPADYTYWQRLLSRRSKHESAIDARGARPTAVPVIDESEPPAVSGRNDELAGGELLRKVGTARGAKPEVRVLGTLAATPGSIPHPVGPFAEDDGAIPLAGETTLDGTKASVRISGSIGDGPHGSAGDGKGDFDFFAVRDVEAGQVLTVDVDAFSAPASRLDALVAVTDTAGGIVALNDDEATSPDSFLQVALPTAGDYFVAITAFGSLPTNPFDSGSGTGSGSEGAYSMTVGLDVVQDVDVYRADLRAGDVLSASLSGAARVLGVFDPQARQVMGSQQDLSANYPEDTTLLGGGNAVVDHVASVPGRHSLVVSRGVGAYEMRLRLLRSPSETAKTKQVLFLDFDGAELNTNIFADTLGMPGGVRRLSPASDFLGGCGVRVEDQPAVIRGVASAVRENLLDDMRSHGANPDVGLDVRTSLDSPDPWGKNGVSRVIIGGTRAELGNPAARFNGIAQSIDPGNIDREETAVVLLDHVCAPSGTVPVSANDFVGPGTDIVRWVSSGLGFIASHESGHFFGSWHTANQDGVTSIMDQFDLTQLGVGADGFGGTADDVDVDFVSDAFNPVERFAGVEDTLNRGAFGLSTRRPRHHLSGATSP